MTSEKALYANIILKKGRGGIKLMTGTCFQGEERSKGAGD